MASIILATTMLFKKLARAGLNEAYLLTAGRGSRVRASVHGKLYQFLT